MRLEKRGDLYSILRPDSSVYLSFQGQDLKEIRPNLILAALIFELHDGLRPIIDSPSNG